MKTPLTACLLAALLGTSALAQESSCGGFPKADNGPYDYRKVRDRRLAVVEQFHFTHKVESLMAGSSSQFVADDLSFTLRAFPNHHRALLAIAKLGERTKSQQPTKSMYTIDCWFDRATRFAPDDHVAKMLYAQWLGKQKRMPEALAQMKQADGLVGDSPLSLQSLGLLYLELGEPELALARAQRAYALGLQAPALRDALKAAGRWVEPVEAPASEASAPASAASE